MQIHDGDTKEDAIHTGDIEFDKGLGSVQKT